VALLAFLLVIAVMRPTAEGLPQHPEELICDESLGGLLKSYRRRAA
jgi:hypothetical protein